MLICSLVASVICLGMSIYMSVVLRDTTSYTMTLLFLIAVVWLGVNVKKNHQKEKEKT